MKKLLNNEQYNQLIKQFNDITFEEKELRKKKTSRFLKEHFFSHELILNDINENLDQDILVQLCSKQYDDSYRIKAMKYVDDSIVNQRMFIEIANDNKEFYNVRCEAIKKINPKLENIQEFLYELIIKSNVEGCIGYNAVYKIWDEDLLISLGNKFPSWNFCKLIVDRIADQEVLTKIICNNPHLDICFDAIKKVTDKKLFNFIVNNCKFYRIRESVIENIWDLNVLEDISKNDKHVFVRLSALEKLYNMNNPYGDLFKDIDCLKKYNFFDTWRGEYEMSFYLENTPLTNKDLVIINIIATNFGLEFSDIGKYSFPHENSYDESEKKNCIHFYGEGYGESYLEKKIKSYCPIGFKYDVRVSLTSLEELEEEHLNLMYGRY